MKRLAWGLLALALAGTAACGEAITVDRFTLEVAGAEPRQVELPTHIGVADDVERFQLRAVVEIPEAWRSGPLTLTVTSLMARTSLLADGAPAVDIDPEENARYRSRGWHAWRLPREAGADGRVELSLVVSNRFGASTWFEAAPRLSATESGDTLYLLIKGFNEISAAGATALILLLLVVYGVTHLIDRRRQAELYFALMTACGGFTIAYIHGLTQPLLGTADGPVTIVVVSVATWASLRSIHAQFHLPPPPRAFTHGLAAVVAVAVVAHGPFASVRYGVPLAAIYWGTAIGWQVVVLARLARRKPPPTHARALLTCLGVVAAAAGLWLLPWAGAGSALAGVHTVPAGFAFYTLVLSFALSHDRAQAVERVDTLNQQLHARLRELESKEREIAGLNTSLRREIARRSRRLAEALARLGEEVSPLKLAPGDKLDERYRVVKELAPSPRPLFEVERGEDEQPFLLELVEEGEPRAVAALVRDVQRASATDHPALVPFVDVVVIGPGHIGLVAETPAGRPLERCPERPSQRRALLEILAPLASALAALHERGLAHRGVEPARVWLSEDPGSPRARLFGAGVPARRPSGAATENDPFATTAADAPTRGPAWLAPELERAGSAGDELPADVFALFALARTLAGPADPGELLSAELQELLDRAGAADPADRPAMSELAAALRRALESED